MFATPLEYLARFSQVAGREIWIKRDDCNGDILTSGNKQRKLLNLLRDAHNHSADVVLTSGGPQSNHARATAALAIKSGLKPVLVLGGEEPEIPTANYLLNRLMNVQMIFTGAKTQEEMNDAVHQQAEKLRRDGHTPYSIPVGGSNGIGSAAYVEAYKELKRQNQEIVFDWLFVAAGSGGTMSGLLIGKHMFADTTRIVGISPWLPAVQIRDKVDQCIKETLSVLGVGIKVNLEDILISDAYIGDGYGIPTQEGITALKLLAQTEAILLDYSYTSKTMAACLQYIDQGIIKPSEKVLFWHTGGAPSIFTRGIE
ncbi:D-cysteine desulfhydrase family protein [Sporomusa sp.]|uniref:1-aminocyclopropane-1-carboxylate deaminase/D-cysteine desulfhydrase n=1 Tax=Sporomusa sp. TaxID=2078658 RepID=UPI002CC71C93|nr:D-cysteine desulfhydrase family protein [Sporomusa sp.]HWR06250.1 D-cysteine desulfhydrase family protein [Sporomusa sp.]